jgi:hypothetical protein
MKRILTAVAIAAVAAVTTPITARAQAGCAWWDVTCNGFGTVSDYGWHIAGRDSNGDVLYVRRRVDSNGNVLFEQARRNDNGRYVIGNTHTVNTRTHSSAGDCKYKSNPKGYSEQCKYAKPAKPVTYDKHYYDAKGNKTNKGKGPKH